jgi:hypothetical protein
MDFDFFGNQTFDPEKLVSIVPFMADAQITQREPNTLTGTVDRDGIVKIFFLASQIYRAFSHPMKQ